MNADQGRDPEREMAEGLADALERSLAPGAAALSLKAARDVAQILDLEGLDRALAAFEPHAGRALPRELEPLRDRLLRISARAREAGRDAPFREDAGELAALAEEIGAVEWSSVASESSLATLSALEAFEDVLLAEPVRRELDRVRLEVRVAAALRAALDWLDANQGAGRSMNVRTEGSVLEVTLPAVAFAGLEPAGHILGSVGGSLAPGSGGAWIARVPCVATRATYLVVVQGERTLALPWHSVLRVHMLPAAQIELRSSELGIPLTVPFALSQKSTSRELPVVTLALGLKRAWLVADRLIWRLAGESGSAGPAGSTHRVRTDDGTECELVDLEHLLAPLPNPPLRLAPPVAPASVAPAPSIAPPSVAPPPSIAPPSVTAPPSVAHAPPASPRAPRVATPAPVPAEPRAETPPPSLSREHVRAREIVPRALTRAEVFPLPGVSPFAAPPPRPAPEPRVPQAPVLRPPTEVGPAWTRVEPEAAFRPRAERELEPRPWLAQEPAPQLAPPAAGPHGILSPIASGPAPAEAGFLGGFAAAFGRPASDEPDSSASAAPRALVAEDSFVARVFLTRLLEAEGFEVHPVDRANAMKTLLAREGWALVCLDVDFPDASGQTLFSEVARRIGPEGATALVALVRDEDDEAVASRSGVSHVLQKPFDRDEVRQLIGRLRLTPRSPA